QCTSTVSTVYSVLSALFIATPLDCQKTIQTPAVFLSPCNASSSPDFATADPMPPQSLTSRAHLQSPRAPAETAPDRDASRQSNAARTARAYPAIATAFSDTGIAPHHHNSDKAPK